MSDPAEDPGVATTGGRFLTPAEARQDAADRLVGRRTLLALRVVLVVTGLVWGTAYLLIHPDVGRIDSPVLTLVAVEVWVLPPIAALIAIIVCRRPARRQMWGMREGINVGGGMGVLEGGSVRPSCPTWGSGRLRSRFPVWPRRAG